MSENYRVPSGFRIVSGGQTGADQAALDWAIARGVGHGGWCPKGRRAERGSIDPKYLLMETPRADYLERTAWNVRDSDATVIFTLAEELAGGSKRSASFAESHGKPWLHMRPRIDPKFLVHFLDRHRVVTLNVAGTRESLAPGIGTLVAQVLDQAMCVPRG